MLTDLGRFLRKLRIDRNELLKHMAQKLEVSVSFLSAVENGNKKMPSEWNQRICTLYDLDSQQQVEFTEAIAKSEKTLDIPLWKTNDEGKMLAVSFARKLPFLTEEQIAAMKDVIEGE